MSRAFRSSPSIRSRTFGSRYRSATEARGLAPEHGRETRVARRPSRRGDRGQEVVDQAVGGVALRLGAVRGDDAVAQDRVSDGGDVLGGDVEAALEQRARL